MNQIFKEIRMQGSLALLPSTTYAFSEDLYFPDHHIINSGASPRVDQYFTNRGGSLVKWVFFICETKRHISMNLNVKFSSHEIKEICMCTFR